MRWVRPAMPGATQPANGGRASASAPGNGSNGSTALSATGSGREDVGWIWPAQGSLVAGFDEAKNKGLDISGNSGDPVVASADGRVVYSGAGLRGYGNLIILKHNNTFLTAYAHNKTLLVKEDQTVKQGARRLPRWATATPRRSSCTLKSAAKASRSTLPNTCRSSKPSRLAQRKVAPPRLRRAPSSCPGAFLGRIGPCASKVLPLQPETDGA